MMLYFNYIPLTKTYKFVTSMSVFKMSSQNNLACTAKNFWAYRALKINYIQRLYF